MLRQEPMKAMKAIHIKADTNDKMLGQDGRVRNVSLNVGDSLCCPLDYYPQLAAVSERLDIRTLRVGKCAVGDAIIGAGGMLYPSLLPLLADMTNQPVNTRLVMWGVGANTHGTTSFVYPKFLSAFDLVGLRDFGNPYQYVPCPTCQHRFFNLRPPDPIYDVVIYEHSDHPVELLEEIPRMNNAQPRSKFWDVLKFLSSGKVVLTNTFHGAYWTMMLNRPVVIYKPFSNRFYGFQPAMTYATEDDWQQQLARARAVGTDYLAECRKRNNDFALQVIKLFSKT